MRWVACGNLEPRKPEEDNFSSGADASALRILVWCAARFQWLASTLDVRTAFLNAKMVLSEDEDLILVKPPALHTEKKLKKLSTASEDLQNFGDFQARGSTRPIFSTV